MALLEIRVDSRDSERVLERVERALEDVGVEARQVDTQLTRTSGGFKRFADSLFSVQTLVASLATGAFVQLSREMFRAGSAVEETASKFRTTFGPAAGDAQAFLDEFANTAGFTNQVAQDLTAGLGVLAQGMGATASESAAFSEQALRLAADLGSFHNTGAEDALAAIRSALVGESEPIRRFIGDLKASDIQLRALADTGKTTADELTSFEKATAALALVTERAGPAVGDLDRTMASAANTARRVEARFLELKDAVGVALLPVFAEMLGSLDRSTGGFDQLARQLRGMATEVAIAAIEVQKLDNFVRVITLDRSFAEGRATAEQLNREIQRLRAVATGVYDEARANEDVLALAFGLSDDDARRLAEDWNALGEDIQTSTTRTVDQTVREFERLRDDVDDVVGEMNREVARSFRRQAEAMESEAIGGATAVQAAFVGLDKELDQTTLPAIEATTLDSFAAIAESTGREVGNLTTDVLGLFRDLGVDLPGPLGDIASVLERDLIGSFADVLSAADEFPGAFISAFESVASALPGIVDTIAGFVSDLGQTFFFQEGGTTLGFGGSGPTGPGFPNQPGVNLGGGSIETASLQFELMDIEEVLTAGFETQRALHVTSNQLLFGIATNTASLRLAEPAGFSAPPDFGVSSSAPDFDSPTLRVPDTPLLAPPIGTAGPAGALAGSDLVVNGVNVSVRDVHVSDRETIGTAIGRAVDATGINEQLGRQALKSRRLRGDTRVR